MNKVNSNNISVQDKLSEAINALDSGDPAGALGKVNNYLEENKTKVSILLNNDIDANPIIFNNTDHPI